jgi:hypothetical protein
LSRLETGNAETPPIAAENLDRYLLSHLINPVGQCIQSAIPLALEAGATTATRQLAQKKPRAGRG